MIRYFYTLLKDDKGSWWKLSLGITTHLWHIWSQTSFTRMPVQQTDSEVELLLPFVQKKNI